MPTKTTDPKTPCQRCGSSHFQLASFAQYTLLSKSGYSRSDYIRQTLVCLCGEPIPISKPNPRNSEDQSFQKSRAAAHAYHERTGPERIAGELARDFITHADFQTLSEQVSALEAVLQQLGMEEQKTGKEDQKSSKKTPG
jgi:hypothetical protein